MNKTNCKCEGCLNMGIWGCCRYVNKISIDIDKLVEQYKLRELNKQEDIYLDRNIIFTKAEVYRQGIEDTINSVLKLEKQGEQKPFDYENAPIIQKDFASKEDVEPKFKIGDLVVYNRNDSSREILYVYDIRDGRYYFNDNIYFSWSVKECDEKCHLWTIQDAKDGDVLACNINKAEIGGNIEKLPNITPTICIYQNVVKDKDYIHTYCSLYNGSSLVLSNSMYYNTFVYNIHPATKEQRDILFTKMKEAGYEWDAEKKELKKIEDESEFETETKMINLDKACEWLKNNKDHPSIGCEDCCLSGFLTEEFIEDFRKAMMEK